MKQRLDKYFGISKMGSNFKTEILAGVVTFAALSYILMLNPQAMQGFPQDAGTRTAALLVATAFGAIVGTLIVSLYAKLPFVQAPGMGLNTMVGSILAGGASSLVFENLMAIIFVSGLVFVVLSILPVSRGIDGKLIKVREKLFDSIPKELTTAIGTGIGLFVAFVGLHNAGVIRSDVGTLVGLVDFGSYTVDVAGTITCFVGLIAIVVLNHFKVKGSILIGLLLATVVAGLVSIPFGDDGLLDYQMLAGNSGVSWKFWQNFGDFFSFDSDKGAFGLFAKGFDFPAGSLVEIFGLILAFSMVDVFDTIGAVVALGQITKGERVGSLISSDGKPLRYNKAMLSDAMATVAGSMMGTSNVVIYVESGAGIVQGGRTGLTGVVAAGLFFVSLFVLPVFAFIPTAAAASVLLYVGILMASHVADINFKDIRFAAPAFVTIIAMPLTHSIVNGIGLGIITFVCISMLCWTVEKFKVERSSIKTTKVEPTNLDNYNFLGSEQSNLVLEKDDVKLENSQDNSGNSLLDQSSDDNEATVPKTKFPTFTAILVAVCFVVYFIAG